MDFANSLIKWYKVNKRDLPWRKTTNPYYIWISEIILQQTRVAQGLTYYINFLDNFPTIQELSIADEDKVLKTWQGLGYYSRARNLHHTAKYIVENYNGKLPNEYDKLLELKGIGSYTAAAIASFAFGLPYAVVDGNVIRVLSRFFGIHIPFDTPKGKKEFQKLAQQLVVERYSSIYNQSIMEFGALQCKPKSPNCFICPLQDSCQAFNQRVVGSLPVKLRKIIVKQRFLHYLMIETKNGVYIGKRKSGIWKGLYEFPFLEYCYDIKDDKVMHSDAWIQVFKKHNLEVKLDSVQFVHRLSHQKIFAKFWRIKAKNLFIKDYEEVALEDIQNYPVSRLIDKYLNTIK